MKYKEFNAEDKIIIKKTVLERTTHLTAVNLTGAANYSNGVKPSKKDMEKFQKQLEMGHSFCKCVGCMELAKIFIDKSPVLKEQVVQKATIFLDTCDGFPPQITIG